MRIIFAALLFGFVLAVGQMAVGHSVLLAFLDAQTVQEGDSDGDDDFGFAKVEQAQFVHATVAADWPGREPKSAQRRPRGVVQHQTGPPYA